MSLQLRWFYRIEAGILRRMRRLGIRVVPYLTVREGGQPQESVSPRVRFECGFIRPEHFPQVRHLEPELDEKKYVERFNHGNLCYTVRDGDKIVAKMWCALSELDNPGFRRTLEDDEVYLFAAYTDPDYRGLELAPYMRVQCYDALRQMGRSRFYSYTDHYNMPARRFKAKIGAVNESLRVYVDLFGRFSWVWTIRKYN